MVGKKSLMAQLREFKKQVGAALGVSKILLFGSQATGTAAKDSDVDLVVVSDKFKQMNFFRRAALMYDYWDLRVPVDFLCYTPKEFESLSKRITIVSHAVKHGIVI